MNEILRAEGLKKTYQLDEVQVPALRGVDLTAEYGDFSAIVGPSGCGKSTLLYLLGCLDRPTEGKVFFNGEDVSDMGDGALTRIRSQYIGFIFQTFNLMPTLNAKENVVLQLRLAGIKGGKYSKIAEEALEKVGLRERMKHLPKQLSGGERQRVAVARAIAKKPQVVLADEPTGNLDSEQGGNISRLLADLNATGQTIIMVTHNTELAASAKRVITMRDGQIADQ
jgi:putative ABC transport system ATP-binding protein